MSEETPPRPKSKEMWAILHIPSGAWEHGSTNETLYWAEHEARLAIRRFSENAEEIWKPIRVKVTVKP